MDEEGRTRLTELVRGLPLGGVDRLVALKGAATVPAGRIHELTERLSKAAQEQRNVARELGQDWSKED